MAHIGICSIPGCRNTRIIAHGWCSSHYQRWYLHGSTEGGATGKGELRRYLDEVVIPYDGDDCLTWPYATNGVGYGTLRIDGKSFYAHRLACEAVNGPPPTPKHEAAHNCGNGHLGCCNPRHMRWATKLENEADKLVHGTRIRASQPNSGQSA